MALSEITRAAYVGFALLCPLPTQAQEAVTGADLYSWCLSEDQILVDRCVHFISGAVLSIALASSKDETPEVCLPLGFRGLDG
jgi:hypothetical protein